MTRRSTNNNRIRGLRALSFADKAYVIVHSLNISEKLNGCGMCETSLLAAPWGDLTSHQYLGHHTLYTSSTSGSCSMPHIVFTHSVHVGVGGCACVSDTDSTLKWVMLGRRGLICLLMVNH